MHASDPQVNPTVEVGVVQSSREAEFITCLSLDHDRRSDSRVGRMIGSSGKSTYSVTEGLSQSTWDQTLRNAEHGTNSACPNGAQQISLPATPQEGLT